MIHSKAEPAKARNAKQNVLIQSAARKNKPLRFSALRSKLPPPSFLSQKSVICMKFCAQATMVCKILKAFGPAVLHRATRAANKLRTERTAARRHPREDFAASANSAEAAKDRRPGKSLKFHRVCRLSASASRHAKFNCFGVKF